MTGYALILAGLLAYGWLVLFQLALAAGAPLGRMAWGGASSRLSGRLRWASAASAGIGALGGLAMAQMAGLPGLGLPVLGLRIILAVLCLLFAVSLLGNGMSQSRIERWHGVPLALLLSVSSGYAAFF